VIERPPRTELARQPASEVLPRAVQRAYRRTSKRMTRALAELTGADGDAALHEARKAAKRARYAGEAVASAFDPSASRFARQMKKLQSVLGDHQDRVISRHVDRELAMAAHKADENAFTYGVLYARDDQEAARLRDRAARTWRRASRRRYRRWLG